MKKTILNREWFDLILCSLVLGVFAFFVFNKSIIVCVTFIIVIAFLHLICPNRFSFNEDGYIIHYGYGFKIQSNWEDIHKIWTAFESSEPSRPISLRRKEYRFVKCLGKDNKKLFFMNEAIPKTKKTTREIEKYYKGKIEE